MEFIIGATLLYTFNQFGPSTIGKLVKIKSTVDGKHYYVLPTKNKQDAANLLAKLKELLNRVTKLLPQNDQYKLKNVIFYEMDHESSESIAYNQNKTNIYLCLRERPPNEKLASLDILLFIALHEIAHTLQNSYSEQLGGKSIHDDKFRAIEQDLFNKAKQLGLMNTNDVIGSVHCGRIMPNPKNSM